MHVLVIVIVVEVPKEKKNNNNNNRNVNTSVELMSGREKNKIYKSNREVLALITRAQQYSNVFTFK